MIEDCISFVSLPCVIICQEYLCCSLNPLTSDKSDKCLNSSYDIGYQYQYRGNCPPTSPLTLQQSIDNKLGLMLGLGEGQVGSCLDTVPKSNV